MSLNITFTCNANSIVDESDNLIDCNYKAFYVRQGIWNDTRTTAEQQYNFNAGDSDSLGQTGELKVGDAVIICLWQDTLDNGGTSLTTNGLKTRFCTFSIVHDGSSIYNIVPQLKAKLAPKCDWSFSLSQIINENYTATPLSDDEDSWVYQGNTFYHRRNYYSTLVFDSVGVITDEYDYLNDGVFATTNNYTYDTIADTVAVHRATNAYDLSSTCSKTIRTFYHAPTPDILFSPDTVLSTVKKGQDLTITYEAFNHDIDSRVVTLDSHLNYIALDSSIISTDTSVTGATSNITSVKNIDILSRINAVLAVHWNDGWNDQVIYRTEQVSVTNTLPTTKLYKTDLTTRNKRFSHVSQDLDGEIVSAKYDVYLLMPFGAGWSLVQSTTNSGASLNDPVEVTFSNNGRYKTVLTVLDNCNTLVPQPVGEVVDELQFDISVTTCTPESYEAAKIEEIFFIFPDTTN